MQILKYFIKREEVMDRKYVLLVIALCMFFIAISVKIEAEAAVYLAGYDDSFAFPEDTASPSTVLSTVIGYRWKTQNFDLTIGLNGGDSNRWIAHTFSNLPSGIASAMLQFRIQGGNDLNAWDDDFWILFYDEITPEFDLNKKAYRVAIGNRGGTTQGLAEKEWGPGETATINLNLSALPLPDGTTISVLEDIEYYGFIDVIVTDDTAVDFYRLTLNAAKLVSINDTGTDSSNGVSIRPSLSSDGRYVAFDSTSTDLGPNDTNIFTDVYVSDTHTGMTTMVSVNSGGTDGGNNHSALASVSGDGRYVAFASRANNLGPADSNGDDWDVYIRDFEMGTTTLVSVNSGGDDSGNRGSYSSSISADGRYVAFESDATNLGPNDTNNTSDVYVRDLETGATTLISVNEIGDDSGNLVSYLPAISADGRFVAFLSLANDFGPVDNNETFDVYVRDLITGTTRLVSTNDAGTDSGNDESLHPSISAYGRYVAFHSRATDLGPVVTNGERNVYVRDLHMGTTMLVSINAEGDNGGNGDSFRPVISGDGRYVAFRSLSTDFGPTDTNGVYDIYVRNLILGTTTLASVNEAGTDSGNGESVQPAISLNGNYVAFGSLASDLEAIDTNTRADVFLYALELDSDGDGIPDHDDVCPEEDAAGFDIDADGCIDSTNGLSDILETLVLEGIIAGELQNSLLTKVENAEKSADKENTCAAVNKLEALINEINAQRGKKISDDAAGTIVEYTNSVISWLLDQLPADDSC